MEANPARHGSGVRASDMTGPFAGVASRSFLQEVLNGRTGHNLPVVGCVIPPLPAAPPSHRSQIRKRSPSVAHWFSA